MTPTDSRKHRMLIKSILKGLALALPEYLLRGLRRWPQFHQEKFPGAACALAFIKLLSAAIFREPHWSPRHRKDCKDM